MFKKYNKWMAAGMESPEGKSAFHDSIRLQNLKIRILLKNENYLVFLVNLRTHLHKACQALH